MELSAAVQPLVYTPEMYAATSGEEDPEELDLMQLVDRVKAQKIADVLRDLYGLEVDLAEPREEDGEYAEVGDTDELELLRQIAAAVQGHTVDDYYEGRVAPGFVYNHLINHANTDGYYLPVDFPQAFFIDEVSVGSAVRLQAELAALEPALASRYPNQVALVAATPEDEEPDLPGGPVRVWAALSRLTRSALQLNLPIHFG
ncbi:MAG: hypothetical protein ACM3XM_05140 [Mycobacterium leprae]